MPISSPSSKPRHLARGKHRDNHNSMVSLVQTHRDGALLYLGWCTDLSVAVPLQVPGEIDFLFWTHLFCIEPSLGRAQAFERCSSVPRVVGAKRNAVAGCAHRHDIHRAGAIE